MRHNYLVRDAEMEMFDAVVFAAGSTGATGDHDSTAIDLGGPDSDPKDPGVVVAMLTGMTSGGSATVALTLIDCDTSGGSYAFTTPVMVTVVATAYNNALWADAIYLPVPDFGVQQYLKLRCTIAGDTITAGKIDAWYAKRAQ